MAIRAIFVGAVVCPLIVALVFSLFTLETLGYRLISATVSSAAIEQQSF